MLGRGWSVISYGPWTLLILRARALILFIHVILIYECVFPTGSQSCIFDNLPCDPILIHLVVLTILSPIVIMLTTSIWIYNTRNRSLWGFRWHFIVISDYRWLFLMVAWVCGTWCRWGSLRLLLWTLERGHAFVLLETFLNLLGGCTTELVPSRRYVQWRWRVVFTQARPCLEVRAHCILLLWSRYVSVRHLGVILRLVHLTDINEHTASIFA